jgi:UDP-N-acetylmuramate--alanine ligase
LRISDINSVYFIGIGGIGMSAIARYFNAQNIKVAGYDKTETKLTKELVKEGIQIHYTENIDQLPNQIDLAIYTPAIPENHLELIHLKEKGHTIYKRSEVLGLISNDNFTIAVAGTHGKTTTSAMIAHILKHSGFGCNAFIGGVLTNYNSNFIEDRKSNTVVVEADEFDRSFLTLKPDISVITSVDLDHLDIYNDKSDILSGFKEFLSCSKINGKHILHQSVQKELNQIGITYGSELGTISIQNIQYIKGKANISTNYKHSHFDFELDMPGIYNAENAMAAILVAMELNIDPQKIKSALKSFKGIVRRFNVHCNGKVKYIDDYAHHPTEITAFIKAVKTANPNKRILGIFQPHLYSRTRDFMTEFGTSLGALDELILLPIYPARETPIEGITSNVLLDHTPIDSALKHLTHKDAVLEYIKNLKFDIILTIGAGDIDTLIPLIKNQISSDYA